MAVNIASVTAGISPETIKDAVRDGFADVLPRFGESLYTSTLRAMNDSRASDEAHRSMMAQQERISDRGRGAQLIQGSGAFGFGVDRGKDAWLTKLVSVLSENNSSVFASMKNTNGAADNRNSDGVDTLIRKNRQIKAERDTWENTDYKPMVKLAKEFFEGVKNGDIKLGGESKTSDGGFGLGGTLLAGGAGILAALALIPKLKTSVSGAIGAMVNAGRSIYKTTTKWVKSTEMYTTATKALDQIRVTHAELTAKKTKLLDDLAKARQDVDTWKQMKEEFTSRKDQTEIKRELENSRKRVKQLEQESRNTERQLTKTETNVAQAEKAAAKAETRMDKAEAKATKASTSRATKLARGAGGAAGAFAVGKGIYDIAHGDTLSGAVELAGGSAGLASLTNIANKGKIGTGLGAFGKVLSVAPMLTNAIGSVGFDENGNFQIGDGGFIKNLFMEGGDRVQGAASLTSGVVDTAMNFIPGGAWANLGMMGAMKGLKFLGLADESAPESLGEVAGQAIKVGAELKDLWGEGGAQIAKNIENTYTNNLVGLLRRKYGDTYTSLFMSTGFGTKLFNEFTEVAKKDADQRKSMWAGFSMGGLIKDTTDKYAAEVDSKFKGIERAMAWYRSRGGMITMEESENGPSAQSSDGSTITGVDALDKSLDSYRVEGDDKDAGVEEAKARWNQNANAIEERNLLTEQERLAAGAIQDGNGTETLPGVDADLISGIASIGPQVSTATANGLLQAMNSPAMQQMYEAQARIIADSIKFALVGG